ncbi:MAG TPA: ATP-binding protein [Thermoanaerobaculia bacterium]|nr:ATP-binding protein [Thermoanaerobaculia bacterium]
MREPRCFLAIPFSSKLRFELRDAVRAAGFQPVRLDEAPITARTLGEILLEEISRSDFVIADLTSKNPNVYYEVGLARALRKGLLLIAQRGSSIPSDLHGYLLLFYDPTPEGLLMLSQQVVTSLQRFLRFPERASAFVTSGSVPPIFVDWNRLETSEAENLCRELLAQMGFRKVDWEKGFREFDLIAELPRKDPDGYEYNELWLISMGRNAPVELFIDISRDPDYLLHRLMRYEERFERLFSRRQDDAAITILVILLGLEMSREEKSHILERPRKFREQVVSVRFRIWDRDHLTSLIQQFPQLAYKYFSDEGRAQSKYRKTPEELYQENVALAERQAKLISDLTEEKDKRIRAERDAVWKDISFSAAHKMGNPIFAIETNLDPLQKRVAESRLAEALEVISRIRASVEKAKGIVDQFKSLTRAQKIRPIPTLLKPILEDACRVPRERGILCEINCPEDLYLQADPERLSECFDELVANSMHWLDKQEKRINIRVAQPAPIPLPSNLPSDEEFTLIRFSDNGSGVELANKGKIFDAFFTTYDHGTGLGLALVRRIVEGHGGVVFETGIPAQGAEFEIYLPSVSKAAKPRERKRRREKKS